MKKVEKGVIKLAENKFIARIHYDGKSHHIGTFHTQALASKRRAEERVKHPFKWAGYAPKPKNDFKLPEIHDDLKSKDSTLRAENQMKPVNVGYVHKPKPEPKSNKFMERQGASYDWKKRKQIKLMKQGKKTSPLFKGMEKQLIEISGCV